MTVRDGAFQPNSEVDEVRWVPRASAARELTYPGDRAVLDAIDVALRSLVLLVRHAKAGDRDRWTGDDRLRPLDKRGRRQADAMVAPLAGYALTRLSRVRTSAAWRPSSRCRPPGLSIEHDRAIAEGAPVEEARAFLGRVGPGPVVLCTHGDVMEALVGEGEPKKKGSTWLLARRDGRVEPVRYWPPFA